MQPINRRTPTRFESAVDKLHSIARMTSDDIEDQDDKFGQHIASQFRQLPLRSFIILQSKFQNLITEERLASLNANTSEPLSQSIFNDEVDDTSGSNITSNNDFENLYSELSDNTCLDHEEPPPSLDILSKALVGIYPLKVNTNMD
ncbi:hypothetical protein J6590_102205 [Homalodisca vitripennis]|nr:hypothetical protein J6590_102205 [Homalodisca vitripennis]